MSENNDSSEVDSAQNDKEKGRQIRPRILSNFRKESTSTNEIVKSAKNDSGLQNSIETQTDWSWIQDMELIKRIKNENVEVFEEIVNDLGQSSDSEQEDVSVETSITKRNPSPIVEAIGPPKILQFNPEKIKKEQLDREPSPSVSIESEPIENLGQFMKDFNVHLKGGEYCEFCGETTKPWPSIQQQEKSNPELLHCCNDYREFVEALIQYQIEKTRAEKQYSLDMETQRNTIKNVKARKLAEERDQLRNMQRMVEKHKRLERIENLRQEKQQLQKQLQAKQTQKKNEQKNSESENLDKMSNNGKNETNLNSPIDRSIEAKQNLISVDQISKIIDTPVQSQYNLFNQNRSINYQLSNLKYLHEGWTVRPSTPIDLELDNMDEEEFNLIARETVDTIDEKINDKPLIIRKYKNDRIFLTIFSDGTGNIYYPSGRIALSITEVYPGLNLLTAFSDSETNAILIASFDPFGNACANYLNGKAKMILSPLGGLELDADGNRKKRWLWHDQTEHVHAPPFQPLIYSINNNISIRVVNQEKISLHFYAENQICKFKVGTKLKMKRLEFMPPSFKIELSELYLRKKRNRIESLIKLIHNEINYSVKLPKIVDTKDKPKADYLAFRNFKQEQEPKKSKQKSSKFITVP